jgi:hypothetical protein
MPWSRLLTLQSIALWAQKPRRFNPRAAAPGHRDAFVCGTRCHSDDERRLRDYPSAFDRARKYRGEPAQALIGDGQHFQRRSRDLLNVSKGTEHWFLPRHFMGSNDVSALMADNI